MIQRETAERKKVTSNETDGADELTIAATVLGLPPLSLGAGCGAGAGLGVGRSAGWGAGTGAGWGAGWGLVPLPYGAADGATYGAA
jgi:hypothetical protein